MNLLLVTNLFPTPYDPERGVFTLQLVKRLQHYCQVTVVCPLPWFPNWPVLRNLEKYAQFAQTPVRYNIDGIEVHSPKYPLLPKVSENRHADFMYMGIQRYILNLHKEIGFDAVNSQWLYPDSVAVGQILKKIDIPHIATGLGCDVNHDTYEPIKGDKILSMLNDCRAVTVVANSLKDELIGHKIVDRKISVIPNGIDINQFKILDKKHCRQQLSIDTELPVILYVGRLSVEKNVETLINACAQVISAGNPVQLYLVGDGPLEDSLKMLTKELDIEKYVHFVGKVDHSKISIWMNASDYFCLPSLREGCPNVILEALGSGVPVIASRVGAIPDVVNANSGILFTPTKIEELASAIAQAIERNWSARDIAASVGKLSWEHAAAQYFEVFESATKGNSIAL